MNRSDARTSVQCNKVFGIGFHKTATSSLAQALMLLGYRVTGPNGVNNSDIASDVYRMARELTHDFDAFQDNPWPLLYKEADQWCPDSRFILTVRSTQAWIDSVKAHFKDHSTPMRKWIYGAGSPLSHESIYIEKYEQHNREVIRYFKNRPESLLVLNITEGDSWQQICPFLKKNIPNIKFPHVNKASERIGSGEF